MALKSRPMRKEEILALEVVLSYSDMLSEKENWLEMGAPDRHIWSFLKILLDYLQEVDPETALSDPVVNDQNNKPIILKGRFDQEVI